MTDLDRARMAEIARLRTAYNARPLCAEYVVNHWEVTEERGDGWYDLFEDPSCEAAEFHAAAPEAVEFLLARLQESEGERERFRQAVQALAASCCECRGSGWVDRRGDTYAEADWHRVECECRRFLAVVEDRGERTREALEDE
jgi:hypothetical protein